MEGFFLTNIPAPMLCLLLILAMAIAMWIGFRMRKHLNLEAEGLGAIEGSLFALLGLLLAFTFNMSANRFDWRREIFTKEANIIGTAILRAEMYPDSIRNEFRADFKNYLEKRIAFYEEGRGRVPTKEFLQETEKYSLRIWRRATSLSKNSIYLTASLEMIPAINEMIDIVTTRSAAVNARVPDVILLLLFAMSIACSFFAGFSSKLSIQKNWIALSIFLIFTAAVTYVIIDLDRPRRGTITLDANEKLIENLREMFK